MDGSREIIKFFSVSLMVLTIYLLSSVKKKKLWLEPPRLLELYARYCWFVRKICSLLWRGLSEWIISLSLILSRALIAWKISEAYPIMLPFTLTSWTKLSTTNGFVSITESGLLAEISVACLINADMESDMTVPLREFIRFNTNVSTIEVFLPLINDRFKSINSSILSVPKRRGSIT